MGCRDRQSAQAVERLVGRRQAGQGALRTARVRRRRVARPPGQDPVLLCRRRRRHGAEARLGARDQPAGQRLLPPRRGGPRESVGGRPYSRNADPHRWPRLSGRLLQQQSDWRDRHIDGVALEDGIATECAAVGQANDSPLFNDSARLSARRRGQVLPRSPKERRGTTHTWRGCRRESICRRTAWCLPGPT